MTTLICKKCGEWTDKTHKGTCPKCCGKEIAQMCLSKIETKTFSVLTEIERVKKERDLAIELLGFYSDDVCPEECPFFTPDYSYPESAGDCCAHGPCEYTWKDMIPAMIVIQEEKEKKHVNVQK